MIRCRFLVFLGVVLVVDGLFFFNFSVISRERKNANKLIY